MKHSWINDYLVTFTQPTSLATFLLLELLIKKPLCQVFMAPLEVIEGIDQSCKVPLTTKLLLKPSASDPVSCMRVICIALGAYVDHRLHPSSDILLHIEGHGESLSNIRPRIDLSQRHQ